jgi:hypothetical protein
LTARSLSRREIESLGRRLANDEPPTPDDLALLARFQDDYQPAVKVVASVLREKLRISSTGLFDGVALTASSRPAKTFDTLREKLKRGIPLRVIQDVVGFRVVGDMRLSQQDDLCAQIERCFEGSKIEKDDRRVIPSHGYRAVHVIPFVEGLPVEIQIRTSWQDIWAQWSEKLGDIWGRWHRYGLPPEGPNGAERERRGKWIGQYIVVSDAVYEHEVALDRHFKLRRREEEMLASADQSESTSSGDLSSLRDLLKEATEEIIATNRLLRNELDKLSAISHLQSET